MTRAPWYSPSIDTIDTLHGLVVRSMQRTSPVKATDALTSHTRKKSLSLFSTIAIILTTLDWHKKRLPNPLLAGPGSAGL
jgi:hypothetical protein